MIENIRKYTGLMIVVLVLLFVGLVFLGDGVSNSFSSKPVMKVAGQSISQKEFDRNRAVLDLPSSLSFNPLPRESRVLASHYLGDSVIDFDRVSPGAIVAQMGQFLQSSSSPDRFVTNRLNVRKAGIEYGVTPSNEEVESFVENVLFADNEGNYDVEAYNDFIKNRVTNLGGTKGFNLYIKDLLTAQNLSKLLGGGIAPEMETVKSLYENQKQVITAEQIIIEPGSYESKVNPSEEEIKAFYEENKANYNSDELRRVSYIHIQPNWEETLEKAKAEKAKADQLAEEARKKREEAKMKAEDEAQKANAENAESTAAQDPQTGTPQADDKMAATTDRETATDSAQAQEAAPPVTAPVSPEALALVTKLKTMAVYFDSSSAAVKASEEEKITEAAQVILESKDVMQGLTVGGYADLQGNADFNRELSLKRAKAVRDRLIEKGVPASRLTVNHFGEDTSKSAKEDLWKSRRVEISLTKPEPEPLEGEEGEEGEKGEQAPDPNETPVEAVEEPTTPPTPQAPTPTPPSSAFDQLNTVQRNQAVDALAPQVNTFFQKLADNLGEDLEGISKEAGYSLTTTEFFSKENPPSELTKGIQDSPVGSLANAIFLLPASGDSDEKLSDPHKTNNGWFIIRLDEAQESVPLSYEEAKVRVTVDLKKKLAREMMVEDAKTLRDQLAAALKEGQTFEQAAKASDLTVEKKPKLVAGQSFQGRFFGDPAFEPARSTNPGEIAPLELTPSEEEPEQALIIYVAKREIEKDEQYATQLENSFSNLSQASRLVAFENWLNDRYQESNVVPPVLSDNDQVQ